MSSRSEWTPTQGSAAHQVLVALGPAFGPLKLDPSPALHAATCRLRRAGYIEREQVPGRRALHWRRTPTGAAVLAHSAAGLTLDQARVLLLLLEGAQTVRAIHAAFLGRYPAKKRPWIYDVLITLRALGLAAGTAARPVRWHLTELGVQAQTDVRARLDLPATP